MAVLTLLSEKQTYINNLKPILKWAGGKRWLAGDIQILWENTQSTRLVEPFCGGLSIVLQLMPECALLNDINKHVINLYQQVSDGLKIDIEMKNDSEKYYQARQRFNELVHTNQSNTPEAAQLFYYMNRTGYNGLSRFNRKGEFNVPFGKYKKINYQPNFADYAETFSQWNFTTGDFKDVDIRASDFIYVDPPYDVEFTSYAKQDFKWEDQVRLVEWLADFPNPIVASNQATQRIIQLYADHGFNIELREAPRRISCNGDRRPAIEILATRNIDKPKRYVQLSFDFTTKPTNIMDTTASSPIREPNRTGFRKRVTSLTFRLRKKA